ncbi:MAG: hypothetical protein AAF598_01835 [Bacteroidota bacterium]
MKILSLFSMLVCLIACHPQSPKEEPISNDSIPNVVQHVDTIFHQFPVLIANDRGTVQINGLRTLENQRITTSRFNIGLLGFPQRELAFQIDEHTIQDHLPDFYSNDSTLLAFLNEAVISDITFDFVRANTLYFNLKLENTSLKKQLFGRFNVFYQTKRKGQLYGWMLDDVQPL